MATVPATLLRTHTVPHLVTMLLRLPNKAKSDYGIMRQCSSEALGQWIAPAFAKVQTFTLNLVHIRLTLHCVAVASGLTPSCCGGLIVACTMYIKDEYLASFLTSPARSQFQHAASQH